MTNLQKVITLINSRKHFEKAFQQPSKTQREQTFKESYLSPFTASKLLIRNCYMLDVF